MKSVREADRRETGKKRERLPTPETVKVTAEEAEEDALAREALEAVLFQAQKHSQQAIGYSTINPSLRVDTLTHNLFYPQKPLFKTVLSDCLGTPKYKKGQRFQSGNEYYNGQCVIVAVNIHLGYNQHDSVEMNRGIFRSEHVRSYKAEVCYKD
ncbi:hypothetical protein L1987_18996 [Smallanthus sonchifolius]|uniref:Uncharacterized protein n=1 Tax=Smallanthus sonchifolius TaxID=185202 RepID=A0ACB9J3G2_9ASTR|nr:hypothetical protein L1987_18996 [Smallanthus sonchifolius]